MARWAAGIEYLGTGYGGWQAQKQVRSVQETVEAALSRIADHTLRVSCAGRTDAGVHAFQQVVHFDTQAERSAYAWLLGANSILPPEISLRWVQPVSLDFHARYSATARHYRYVIHNHRARSALLTHRAAWWPLTLDAQAMHEAAQALVGTHDFTAFRHSQCQSPTPVRNLQRINVYRQDEFVVMDICANAFLHHMVRNIIGALSAVGLGRQPMAWIAEVLASRDRAQAGLKAPPDGLYFVGPEYPPAFDIPAPQVPWFPG
ncbi:MAG: tRNA pseudouridine(38-40) synthase TruA [Stenotrophobium sp.]